MEITILVIQLPTSGHDAVAGGLIPVQFLRSVADVRVFQRLELAMVTAVGESIFVPHSFR